MDAAKFTYEHTACGWELRTDEPGLGGPLEGTFRYELRLGDLPIEVAVVGHCQVMGMWCVFARDPGSSVIRGVALRPISYGAHDHDPFVVAAETLDSQSARDAVAQTAPGGQHHPAAPSEQAYLAQARRRFLLAGPTERRSLYCSVLPSGFPRRLSPLSCFTLEGSSLIAADRSERSLGGNEHGVTPPKEEEPPPAPASSSPSPWLTEPIPIPAAGTLQADAEPAGIDGASENDRNRVTEDALAAAVLRMEIDRIERVLTRRLSRLWVALVVATALLAASLAAGLWWTSRRLQRVEPAQSAPRDTSSDGAASESELP